MSNLPTTTQEELAGGVISPLELASELQQLSHAAERNRRLRRALISAILFRPLATVISFVSVPLFIKYLGRESYGLYEAIIAFSMWLSLTNIGLGVGLINRLTDCHVSGDRELARRYVSSIWFAIAFMVLVLSLMLTIAVPVVDWQVLFPASNPSMRSVVPWVVWITSVITVAGMLVGMPSAVYTAYQELDRNNYWDAAGKVAVLAACFLVVLTPFGLIGVAFTVLAIPAAFRLINSVWLFSVEKPWLRPQLRLFDWRLFRQTLGDGLYMSILQMAAIAIFQSDKLIISATLGSEAVAGFAVVGRLFLQFYGLFTIVLFSLWPAYGEAIRRGDLQWVRRKLALSMSLGLVLMLTCGIALYFFGNPIMRLWTRGDQVTISKPLVLGMTAMFLIRIIFECQAIPLNAAGILLPQVYVLSINAVLNLVAAILLTRRIGVVGVALAYPISAMLTSLWAYPWLLQKRLKLFRTWGGVR